ncbi:4935_t:CDS:2 [Paraglomus occultum]|uniref:4935_t:CDS:1 n=1 Tax=Paraglomus occultum TaxID=144539 RepID=A0A9N8VNI7_9GLOM|nr:4935_t:CDS:2 [Paraglomus occultum]
MSLMLVLYSLFILSTTLLCSQAAYTCDPTTCVSPNCFCASTTPPGNIPIDQVPQFFVLSFDDAMQPAMQPSNDTFIQDTHPNSAHLVFDTLMKGKKNPNGCPITATYFLQTYYTDFGLVTNWYAAENEVADHTMTHPNLPGEPEITGNILAVNALAGIPKSKITGFRFPFRNYTAPLFQLLSKLGFAYDSTVSAGPTDMYWPYTLDNGIANECWSGICDAGLKLPGMFEFPMYAIPGGDGVMYLMDPLLTVPLDQGKQWLINSFNQHYKNGKAPFGLYLHGAQYLPQPGRPDPGPIIAAYNSVIQYALSQPNVYAVTYSQVLAWMKNPVPVSQLAGHPAFKCTIPKLGKEICNGLDDNGDGNIDEGLKQQCNTPTSTFTTCYNCPVDTPTPGNPLPKSVNQNRFVVSSTCDTVYWDPVAGQCLCQDKSCAFTDLSTIGDSSGNNSTSATLPPNATPAPNQSSVSVFVTAVGSSSIHSSSTITSSSATPTTTDISNVQTSSNGPSAGAMIGGMFALTAIIVGIIMCVVRKKKRASNNFFSNNRQSHQLTDTDFNDTLAIGQPHYYDEKASSYSRGSIISRPDSTYLERTVDYNNGNRMSFAPVAGQRHSFFTANGTAYAPPVSLMPVNGMVSPSPRTPPPPRTPTYGAPSDYGYYPNANGNGAVY